MVTSDLGIDIIKHYEQLHDGDLSIIGLQPKMCPAGIWTEGYGHAMLYKGKFIKGIDNKDFAYSISKIHNEPDAEAALGSDLRQRELQLNSLNLDLRQCEFDACISFIFNLGFTNFKDSTLFDIISNGSDNYDDDVAYQFSRWNKSNGKVLNGLTFRRHSESTLFTTGELQFYN